MIQLYNDVMVSCILLAAGQSMRFGSPKALALLNGETVISRLQRILLDSAVDEIIVVTGAHASALKPYLLNHKRLKVVHNKDYILGQTSSFQAGLREVCPKSLGFMLLPVDYPLVKTQTIDILVDEFMKKADKIIIPTCDSQKGHPPIFPVALKNEFLSLNSSEGLNQVQRCHQENIIFCAVADKGTVKSFNTEEEFESLFK
jgi:CTP:molybdopterin cytidylyltransferase MocA